MFRALAATAFVLVLLCIRAEPQITARPKHPSDYSRVIVLWPEGAPGALGTRDEDVPRLFLYPAPGSVGDERGEHGEHPGRASSRIPPIARLSRSAVIVLPGGGYRSLVMEKEGAIPAQWLNAHGITALVLQYRLGNRYHFPTPMQDGERAVRYVRSHASEFGVSPDRIGVWGFSAGGHLAGYLATSGTPGTPHASDLIERVSSRPDFAILSYARITLDPTIPRSTSLEALIGDHPTPATVDAVTLEKQVNASTSPCFIFSTTGDQTVNSLNATAFYNALKRARVAAELHIFERGPHGVGIGLGLKKFTELAVFPTLLANWMQLHGWMDELATVAVADGKPALLASSRRR